VSFDPKLPRDGVNVTPMHPLRDALVLVVGIGAAAAVLVAVFAAVVDEIVPHVPPSWEAQLFGPAEPEETEAGEGEPGRAQIQALLDRLVRHWPEAPYAFYADILDEPLPNALAVPGGRILVTRGLLDGARTENELAFVLGHELGHFAGRDHLRGLGRELSFSLVLSALGFSSAGGAADIAGFAGGLAQRGFSRDQETDADAFGLAILVEEYGHVAHGWDFFERLPDPDGAIETQLEHYLSTHPLDTDRIETLRALATERGWSTTGEGRPPLGRDPDGGV